MAAFSAIAHLTNSVHEYGCTALRQLESASAAILNDALPKLFVCSIQKVDRQLQYLVGDKECIVLSGTYPVLSVGHRSSSTCTVFCR